MEVARKEVAISSSNVVAELGDAAEEGISVFARIDVDAHAVAAAEQAISHVERSSEVVAEVVDAEQVNSEALAAEAAAAQEVSIRSTTVGTMVCQDTKAMQLGVHPRCAFSFTGYHFHSTHSDGRA